VHQCGKLSVPELGQPAADETGLPHPARDEPKGSRGTREIHKLNPIANFNSDLYAPVKPLSNLIFSWFSIVRSKTALRVLNFRPAFNPPISSWLRLSSGKSQ